MLHQCIWAVVAEQSLTSHQLWDSLDAALSPFRMLSSKTKAIFGFIGFYGQLSVLRQFFTRSSEKEGERGRPSRRVCSAERLAGDAAELLPPALLLYCWHIIYPVWMPVLVLAQCIDQNMLFNRSSSLSPIPAKTYVVSVLKAHLISVFSMQDYFDRAGEVMTQIVDSTNSCAGRSEEVATSGGEP